MMVYRKEAEDREINDPLKSGRLRVYAASGAATYVFDGKSWFLSIKGYWYPCANVPEVGLWVSGHTSRDTLRPKYLKNV